MIDEGIQQQYDVRVDDAFKSYGNNAIINGMNLNVRSGSIYGLLGPSGCGKTTLLQCILGVMQLDSGRIDLNAKCLKDIGYMPQDICLEETLTVKEVFEYYGSLYNMSNNKINNRIAELNEFLKLPDLNSYVNKISGGQCRRVSLAISILHNPKIIILDEPTVGIDPVLREEIWDQFRKMSKQEKKTIVITTHYIEEANQADCIGLMRRGILVEEGPPKCINTKYNTDSLEKSFLMACCNQEKNKIDYTNTKLQARRRSINILTKCKNNFSFYRLRALLKKNYSVCSRDYVLLYTLIVLPVFLALNFCFGIGTHVRDMTITVKNDEVNFLDCKRSNINGCIFDENFNHTTSCIVLNYLQALDYTFVGINNHEAGIKSIDIPNRVAFLYFPKNFTSDLLTYLDSPQDYKSLTYARITKENFLLRNRIKVDVINSVQHLIDTTLNDCSYEFNQKNFLKPLKLNTVYGHEVKTYANGIISIMISLILFYSSSVFSLSIMMAEKMDGTLSRSMIAGVKVLELVSSLFCINTVAILIQILTICSISFVLFSNPIQITNGLFVYMLLMVLIGWIGFFSGLLTAIVAPTKIGGIYIITAVLHAQFILSGGTWPVEGIQNALFKTGAKTLPTSFVGNTMNNIALKGWTLDHPAIVIGTTTTFAYTVLLAIILIILGKFKKDLWVTRK